MLKQIDPKTSTADQIKEAFCRDIDAFSFEFQVKRRRIDNSLRIDLKEVKDERPSLLCMKVPDTACAVAYDRCHADPVLQNPPSLKLISTLSSKCSGGWSLVLPEGQRKFRYWSSDWGYR